MLVCASAGPAVTHTDTNTPVTLQSQLPGAPLSWRLSHIHLPSVPLSLSDLFLQEDFKSATDRRFLDTRPSFLRPGGGRSDPHAPPPLRLHVSLYNKAASPEAWSLPGEHADASPGACKLTNYLSALEGGAQHSTATFCTQHVIRQTKSRNVTKGLQAGLHAVTKQELSGSASAAGNPVLCTCACPCSFQLPPSTTADVVFQ